MSKIKKIFSSLLVTFVFAVMVNAAYAASVTVKAAKTTAYVGDKVKVTVTVKAAAWNVYVSGSASGDIIGFNMDAKNQTTTKTYTVSCKKAGTYTVKVTGDVTDADDTNSPVNKSVTITVKEKATTDTGDKDTDTDKVTKSSNCNLSKISLSVEGLSFKSSQTTYNIKVGADVDSITVKATTAHSKATYTVSGNKNLKAGNNVIKIVVKAEDGTKKTYKINVEKEGDIEETSSALTNLIIENMEFEEPFTKAETEYTATPIKYTEEALNVLAFTEAEQATYVVEGADNLKVGENVVKVIVTSYDESTTTEYTVTFEMLAKEEENAYVSIYNETNNLVSNTPAPKKTLANLLNNGTLVIIVYLLAAIEFAQVIYLYIKLGQTQKELEEEREKNKKD